MGGQFNAELGGQFERNIHIDDQELMNDGLKGCQIEAEVQSVFDGVQLMDYLLHRVNFKHLTSRPDVILLDLNMPLMDGFSVLKEIKKYSHLREIPVYVVTTSNSERDKNKAMQLGATGFYSKGASSKDIRKIMLEVCSECFSEV